MTHESPMNSWKSIGPLVVSALKLGALLPRRRLDQNKRGWWWLCGGSYGSGRSSLEAMTVDTWIG
jgi:hypothetical protein